MKNPRIGTALAFALSLAAAAAAGLYYGRSTSTAPPAAASADGHAEHAGHDEHKAESAEAHSKDAESGHAEGEGHGHGAAEISDLDRPVDKLFAGKCEHDLPHYSCDECRYELGVVKLDADVVSREGKPGLVDAIPAGTASFAESVRLTGEVHVSDARTVLIPSMLALIPKSLYCK